MKLELQVRVRGVSSEGEKEVALDGLRMIDVIWENKTVMMFTVDVEERATLIGKVRPKSKKVSTP